MANVEFRIERGAIDMIAKSSEVQQVCLRGAQSIASAASATSVGSYSADVVVGARRAHARAKVKVPEGFKDRQKFFADLAIFRIPPTI